MYCSNCGKPLREGSNFCGNCGTPVETEDVNAIEAKSDESVKKKTPKAYIIVAVCVIIGIVASIGFVTTRHKANQTVLTQYLYMEGKNYTELTDDYEMIDVSDTGQITTCAMTKSVEIGTTSWTATNTFYSYISDTLEMDTDIGEIRSTYFSLNNRWQYDDSYILSEIEAIYGEYDYLTCSDDFEDYGKSCILSYTSYQWDGVENSNYDMELLCLDEEVSLHFIRRDSQNNRNSDPFAVLAEFNEADTLYEGLNCIEWEDEDEKEAVISRISENLQNLDIEVDLISSIRFSRTYAPYTWSNVLGYYAIDYPDSSEIYLGYANLTAILDEEYETINGYVVIGFYDGEWKIYDISDSNWSSSLFSKW